MRFNSIQLGLSDAFGEIAFCTAADRFGLCIHRGAARSPSFRVLRRPRGGLRRGRGMITASQIDTRVLVVDEDLEARSALVDYLAEQQIRTLTATDGPGAMRQLVAARPDLVILDLQLGVEDGFDVLRDIRGRFSTPVILTTACRRAEADKVTGLELGADDYVTKPLALRELLARVRAVLRRRDTPERSQPPRPPERRMLHFAGWTLDERRRRLFDPRGEPMALTRGEFALLLAFLNAPGRPLSREHLLRATRVSEDILDRSIDVQVLRLRRKLEQGSARMITTERGRGYVFAPAVNAG
jgi:two-component system, OmpR family, response regulator